MIRLLLVDDHEVVRIGLKAVLNLTPGMKVVGQARGRQEAITQCARLQPDLVLLDISMPGGSGLHAVPEILECAPQTRVLMLSVHDDAEYILESVRIGAHGYCRKDSAPDRVVTATWRLEEADLAAVADLEGSAAVAMVSDLEPGRVFLSLRGSGQSLYVGAAPDGCTLLPMNRHR